MKPSPQMSLFRGSLFMYVDTGSLLCYLNTFCNHLSKQKKSSTENKDYIYFPPFTVMSSSDMSHEFNTSKRLL